MKLIKNENEIILLNNDGNEIEKYAFDKEINFRKFIDYLLSLNLSKEITIEDTIDDKTEAEENLILLINSIKVDYNNKVKELISFKESVRAKHS